MTHEPLNYTATKANPSAPFMQPNVTMLTHKDRRSAILEKYGTTIKSLQGYRWFYTFLGFFLVFADLFAAYMLRNSSRPTMVFWGWFFHGTVSLFSLTFSSPQLLP